MKALVPHISFCPELTGKYSHTDVYMFTLLLSHFTYNFVHTPISFFSMLDANESADAPSSFVFLWFQIQNSNSYPLIGFKRIQISSLFISKLSNLASQPAPSKCPLSLPESLSPSLRLSLYLSHSVFHVFVRLSISFPVPVY